MVSKSVGCDKTGQLDCLARETYQQEIFVASDTDVALLSGVPAMRGKNPLDNDEIRVTRDLIGRHAPGRLFVQGVVYPNGGPDALDDLQRLDEEMGVVGWKVYTPWGPTGEGFWLDDPTVGIPFLERVRRSSAKIVFCHKGIPWPIWKSEYASPRDIGPVAKRFPDLKFVVYHSAFDPKVPEGPLKAEGQGVDRLIKTCAEHGIGPSGNVYAELGGTWAVLMKRPVEAAHVIGKLLQQLGEDRILWGTDALFMGTPQSQIEAFRAFTIPEGLRDQFGYPALTAAAKAKIFGLSTARLFGVDPVQRRHVIAHDPITRRRDDRELRSVRRPSGFGPRTRREFFARLARREGRP
jgi:predicted TIM-barrel fold metal-dependent hydrolase